MASEGHQAAWAKVTWPSRTNENTKDSISAVFCLLQQILRYITAKSLFPFVYMCMCPFSGQVRKCLNIFRTSVCTQIFRLFQKFLVPYNLPLLTHLCSCFVEHWIPVICFRNTETRELNCCSQNPFLTCEGRNTGCCLLCTKFASCFHLSELSVRSD